MVLQISDKAEQSQFGGEILYSVYILVIAGFFRSWETCPKSRLATQRAEKAPKALEDEGLAPRLLKDTTREKTRPFHYDQWRETFLCWDGDFGCCFVFCLSSTVTDPKGCWVFPGSPPSPASLLQYSRIFCPPLPFLFMLLLGVVSKENQSLPTCVSQTCWALSLALHALPEKILSLSILSTCKDINSCKLAFDRRFAAWP